jgi:hypothetical protein
MGKQHGQKIGDRAQVYGAVRREIRVTWRRSDYLKPSLQKMPTPRLGGYRVSGDAQRQLQRVGEEQ